MDSKNILDIILASVLVLLVVVAVIAALCFWIMIFITSAKLGVIMLALCFILGLMSGLKEN